MLTKNQYILCLFLVCILGMILGAVAGSVWPEWKLWASPATESSFYSSPALSVRSLSLIFADCAPMAKWILFLLFCGFCVFSAPVTVVCGGVSAFCLGHAFALWHAGSLALLAPTLMMLNCIATLWLAYLSFSFWEVLRDGHICRLYPVENAVFYRLIFRYLKIGSCVLLVRIILICLFRLLPLN